MTARRALLPLVEELHHLTQIREEIVIQPTPIVDTDYPLLAPSCKLDDLECQISPPQGTPSPSSTSALELIIQSNIGTNNIA